MPRTVPVTAASVTFLHRTHAHYTHTHAHRLLSGYEEVENYSLQHHSPLAPRAQPKAGLGVGCGRGLPPPTESPGVEPPKI